MAEANQNDVGFKIAKPFFDVNTAGDVDLIINSSWPTLQIIKEQTVAITTEPIVGPLFRWRAFVEHNIGFPPFMAAWAIYADGTEMRLVDIERYTGAISDVNISSTTAEIESSGDSTSFNMTHVHFKFYSIDLSKEVEYPLIKEAATQVPINNDFGVKFVKEGKSLDSDDMRDFIIHSRCQSPLVQVVKTEQSAERFSDSFGNSGGIIQYKNPVTYLAWVFGYIKHGDGSYSVAPYFSQGYPSTGVDVSTNTYSILFLENAGDTGATLVVLRDPLFSSNDVEVTY